MTAIMPESSEHEASGTETLQVVGDNALRLLAGFPSVPSSLRIQVGEVTIEAEWSTPEQVAAPSPAETEAGTHSATEAGTHSASVATAGPAVRYVAAPMVGVFYRAPEPGAKPFVEVGDKVKAGDQVGIVEAMKLMVPVHADESGTITEILIENGEGVEYGENLIAYSAE